MKIYSPCGGAEVAGWTLDRKIRVRFPAYPHRVWALWWQGGKRRLRTYRCPCRGRLGTLKTPSCPWRGCPAAGQNLETGHLSHHYIAEISLNVTLNHNQQQQLKIYMKKCLTIYRLFRFFFKTKVVNAYLQCPQNWSEWDWLLNVTCNDISVIYVTVHRCTGGPKKRFDLRSGSQSHRHFVGFFNVPVQAPTRGQPFYSYS